MNTSLLAQELEPLEAQIGRARKIREALENELCMVEAELETFSAERQRFDALRDVCKALDRLGELKAGDLFWQGIPVKDAAAHLEQLRSRIARFEGEIQGILKKQASLQAQIDQHNDELDLLYEEVRDAYEREERRREEFVIEREISPVPYRAMIMPWSREAESESRFRRAVLVTLLLTLVLGSLVPLVKVPIPDRAVEVVEIPKRLAMLVKKEAPVPTRAQAPKQPREQIEKTREEPEKPQDKTEAGPGEQKPAKKPQEVKPEPEPTKTAGGGGGGGGTAAARKKAESVGVLAFKNTFKDLMIETPVARLGTEARLSKQSPLVAGLAVPRRSLVAMQAQGGVSGGIGNARVSRNIGSGNVDRVGGIGIGIGSGGGSGGGIGGGIGSGVGSGVESPIADLAEASPRPLSDGPGPGRTDEEIQIVFDRYKAALYRIYNTELRKDPTLRGKILLRICIEPGGEVSMCKVVSTDLASPELVAKIVARIARFNFGPKEGVSKITILYPIDFLPAG